MLIFDGECGFCRIWIERWKKMTGDRIDYRPYQEVASQFPGIPTSEFEKAVHFVDEQGNISRAAEAVFFTLSSHPAGRVALGMYRHLPGFKPLSEFAYSWVAKNRTKLGWLP